jgi:NAD(P)-dependent dehydrogenase (short-subunit alcohol dehydrogenase family)
MTGPDHRKLAGRVCVITGATSGIGFATARLLAEHGAKLVLLGRDKEKLARTTGEIPGAPIGVLGDVTDLGDLRRLMQTTADAYGGIDVLMANAGIGRFAPVDAVTTADFDALCAVHFKAAFFTVQTALPYLRDGASVILMGSAGVSRGFPLTSVYNAAKAAVCSLGRTMAAELAPRGIRVNTISPGLTDTPMASGDTGVPQELRDEAARLQIDKIPMKRIGRPEEVAATALFLASDDSSLFTGSDLCPDGGTQHI